MPFDQTNYQPEPVDEVLRILVGLRELHSNPARWCNTGVGNSPHTTCIVAGANHIARELGLTSGFKRTGTDIVSDSLYAALPAGVGLIDFNEGLGTAHTDLLAFYDRAIAARREHLACAAVASSPA